MKFGQALSIFEAAFPEDVAGPYREMLTKLQENAPPMDAATVHDVLRAELGARWRCDVRLVRRRRGRLCLDRPGASRRLE